VIKAQDYDDALKIANDTQYGLTGAVYSADEKKLERARREFHVRQPLPQSQSARARWLALIHLGGAASIMSGTDRRPGGRDYLLLFMQAKVSA